MLCLMAQSCLTLCDRMDCSPPGSSDRRDSPGKNTGVGCHALLQGIISTQELNQDLLHCRQILYQLSYQGSPIFLYTTLNKVDSYHILLYPDLIIKYTYISIVFLNLHAKWKANSINQLPITECQRMVKFQERQANLYICMFYIFI